MDFGVHVTFVSRYAQWLQTKNKHKTSNTGCLPNTFLSGALCVWVFCFVLCVFVLKFSKTTNNTNICTGSVACKVQARIRHLIIIEIGIRIHRDLWDSPLDEGTRGLPLVHRHCPTRMGNPCMRVGQCRCTSGSSRIRASSGESHESQLQAGSPLLEIKQWSPQV